MLENENNLNRDTDRAEETQMELVKLACNNFERTFEQIVENVDHLTADEAKELANVLAEKYRFSFIFPVDIEASLRKVPLDDRAKITEAPQYKYGRDHGVITV